MHLPWEDEEESGDEEEAAPVFSESVARPAWLSPGLPGTGRTPPRGRVNTASFLASPIEHWEDPPENGMRW
jgi:hypothetical protein